jgi:glycosyltransferase involved in cell wall biosynthesis
MDARRHRSNGGGLLRKEEGGTCGHLKASLPTTTFDAAELAKGIRWVLENSLSANLRANARERAVSRFSYPVVAQQYLEVYQQAIDVRAD